MSKENIKKILILVAILCVGLLIVLIYNKVKENNKVELIQTIIEEEKEQTETEQEESQENNKDESTLRFENYMKNIVSQREARQGVWQEETLELKLNLTDEEYVKDEISLIINKSGKARLVINNDYLYLKYGTTIPNVSTNAVSVISGNKLNTSLLYFYLLNEDGTVTQIRVGDEIEIIQRYDNLKNIVKLEKRDVSDDYKKPFIFYDIDGNMYEY